jgi:hypothetical protein
VYFVLSSSYNIVLHPFRDVAFLVDHFETEVVPTTPSDQ